MTSTSSRTHRSPSPSRSLPRTRTWMDDLTLGEMLTEAYRGQVDYFVQEGVSVSQLSSSVRFDRSGQLDRERMVDRSGQPDECNSSNAQIRTLHEEQRHNSCGMSRKSQSSRTPSSSSRRRAPTPSRTIMATEIGISFNKVIQRWKNYGNFRVLPSILWQGENSSRIRTLSWNSLEEYRN